ncbi:MAG: hypothetical protein IT376_23495 [Polyangiaceae bacterium]|nr:hypothetical protein [Polyangiaceae bacterium]
MSCRGLAILLGVAMGAGCTCSREGAAPAPPASASATGGRTVNLAESRRVQARLAAASASAGESAPPATDGRERVKGEALHRALGGPCRGDRACLLERCGQACSEWIREAYAPGAFASPRHAVQVQVNCTGACLGGGDAGVTDAAAR